MTQFVARRVGSLLLTLVAISLVTFALLKSAPGDPVELLAGERASPQTKERMRKDLGLDRPFFSQYASYLGGLVRADFGVSYVTKAAIRDEILVKFRNTIVLAVCATAFAIVVGITLGTLAATAAQTWLDRAITVFATSGISTPVYWSALLLVFVFAHLLGWLPAAGTWTDSGLCLILPVLTLGSRSAAYIARITRAGLLEVFTEPFIVAARAKGLGRAAIVLKHSLKNALVPILTLAAVDFGSYLNGSVLTETIFGWDGLGRYAMNGILQTDYPVVLAAVVLGAAVFVLVNAAVDILVVVLHPPLRERA